MSFKFCRYHSVSSSINQFVLEFPVPDGGKEFVFSLYWNILTDHVLCMYIDALMLPNALAP